MSSVLLLHHPPESRGPWSVLSIHIPAHRERKRKLLPSDSDSEGSHITSFHFPVGHTYLQGRLRNILPGWALMSFVKKGSDAQQQVTIQPQSPPDSWACPHSPLLERAHSRLGMSSSAHLLYPLYPYTCPFLLNYPVTTHILTWTCSLLRSYPFSLLGTLISTIRDKNLDGTISLTTRCIWLMTEYFRLHREYFIFEAK